MQYSSKYIIGFCAAICLVCSIFVSGSAVGLKDRQEANKVLDRQKKVLTVAGLMKDGESITPERVKSLFEANIVAKLVDLKTGAYAEGDAAKYDQRKATKDPALSGDAQKNRAGVKRVAKLAQVYHVTKDKKVTAIILPIEGKGLWSTLYGFIALDKDLQTINGITFYAHAETPGLGGEVDNPRWKAKWSGRKAFDAKGGVAIKVKKGIAGSVDKDPHQVDGLAGATITSNGVTYLVQFWLGEGGFGAYLAKLKKGGLS